MGERAEELRPRIHLHELHDGGRGADAAGVLGRDVAGVMAGFEADADRTSRTGSSPAARFPPTPAVSVGTAPTPGSFSQSRQVTFSRAVSTTFHRRGSDSNLRVTSSPRLRRRLPQQHSQAVGGAITPVARQMIRKGVAFGGLALKSAHGSPWRPPVRPKVRLVSYPAPIGLLLKTRHRKRRISPERPLLDHRL